MTAKADPQALEQPSLFEDLNYETDLPEQDRPHDKVSVPDEACLCTFCSRSVDPHDESTYHEVRTWVHGIKKDSSVLRTYTGLYACPACIAKLRRGIAPTQKDLTQILAEPSVSERATPGVEAEPSVSYGLGVQAGYEAVIHGNPVLTFADREMQDDEFANGYWDGVKAGEFQQIKNQNQLHGDGK